MLRRRGHNAWTAANARRSRAQDDELTVYADDRDAVLISHDVEFSERRKRNVVGRHVFLRCNEWEAAGLLERHLDDLVPVLSRYNDVWVKLSGLDKPELSFRWE